MKIHFLSNHLLLISIYSLWEERFSTLIKFLYLYLLVFFLYINQLNHDKAFTSSLDCFKITLFQSFAIIRPHSHAIF